MLLLAVAGILFTAAVLSGVFYNFFSGQMKAEVRQEAVFFAKSLLYKSDYTDYLQSLALSQQEDRITLIGTEGEILFDSYMAPSQMENHANRPEFITALSEGYGDDKRFSETLHEETYYYAIRLEDGSVLRAAKTTDSILSVFFSLMLPILAILLFVLILCRFASRRLTKRIVDPINQMDPEAANKTDYEEISPFLLTISRQREEIKTQMDNLEERANTIKTIIQDMREGLILLDEKGTILSANASALRLFCENPQDYTGKNIRELFRSPELLAGVKTALSGSTSDLSANFDGKTVQLFFDPVKQGNRLQGAIVLFLDITEKANAEQMRREFTANVSHELKTPLTTISALSEMVSSGMAKEEDVPEFNAKIRAEAQRMITLINDILRLAELDEGTGANMRETFDLLPLAESVKSSLSGLATEKGVHIQIQSGALELCANRTMLEELLINLTENAIKYNRPEGSVTLSFSRSEDEVNIKVSDTGIGIEKEHLPRIFERFYRVDKSRSKKTGGTGLGLSIVKHIAIDHGGRVEIESKPGEGTSISVILCSV